MDPVREGFLVHPPSDDPTLYTSSNKRCCSGQNHLTTPIGCTSPSSLLSSSSATLTPHVWPLLKTRTRWFVTIYGIRRPCRFGLGRGSRLRRSPSRGSCLPLTPPLCPCLGGHGRNSRHFLVEGVGVLHTDVSEIYWYIYLVGTVFTKVVECQVSCVTLPLKRIISNVGWSIPIFVWEGDNREGSPETGFFLVLKSTSFASAINCSRTTVNTIRGL